MFELCDECPYPLVEQEKRLEAVRALSQANIDCVVWGEDALAFVHWVPTHLFFLHLVVADHNVSRAAQKVFETLPCEVFTGHHKELDEFWVDDLDEPRIYPNAATLRPTELIQSIEPEIILIHPESDWNFNVADRSLSVPLSPFPENIRFPNRTAFINSLIECTLDPPSGRSFVKALEKNDHMACLYQ